MQHPAIGFVACPLQVHNPRQPGQIEETANNLYLNSLHQQGTQREEFRRIGWMEPAAVFNWQIKMRRRETKFCIWMQNASDSKLKFMWKNQRGKVGKKMLVCHRKANKLNARGPVKAHPHSHLFTHTYTHTQTEWMLNMYVCFYNERPGSIDYSKHPQLGALINNGAIYLHRAPSTRSLSKILFQLFHFFGSGFISPHGDRYAHCFLCYEKREKSIKKYEFSKYISYLEWFCKFFSFMTSFNIHNYL